MAVCLRSLCCAVIGVSDIIDCGDHMFLTLPDTMATIIPSSQPWGKNNQLRMGSSADIVFFVNQCYSGLCPHA